MARTGLSYDQVAAVADTLVAEGIPPTQKLIRERLGSGSYNTIQRHLAAWRASRPPLVVAATELSPSIIVPICQAMEQARAEGRAENEDRLVIVQAELAELAVAGEELEAKMEAITEDNLAVSTERDMLIGKVKDQQSEIDRLTREVERELYSAEQARTEVAQTRNKAEMNTEKLADMSSTIDRLMVANATATQARNAAEKMVAVLTAKLESEAENAKALSKEKETLLGQVAAERQSGESLRIQNAKMANELELLAAALTKNESAALKLTESFEAERTARIAAEKKAAVQTSRLEEQGKTISRLNKLLPLKSSKNRVQHHGQEGSGNQAYSDGG